MSAAESVYWWSLQRITCELVASGVNIRLQRHSFELKLIQKSKQTGDGENREHARSVRVWECGCTRLLSPRTTVNATVRDLV
jgi:hypothetical protein